MVQETAAKAGELEVVEMFAGAARVSRLAQALGLATVALDKVFCDGDNKSKTNCMDLNTSAGFLFLGNNSAI